MTRLEVTVTGMLLCAAGIVALSQYRSQTALRAENENLRRKVAQLTSNIERLSNPMSRSRKTTAPRVPAPPMLGGNASGSSDDIATTNLIAVIVHGGELPALTAAQLSHYLEENQRNAASLLSVYRTSKDPALLREAMEKYPGNPEVAFEAILSKATSPEDRRQWLDAFKQAAPDNPLPNYLSALDLFKSGQTDQAVQELIAASGRTGFSDYTAERIQTDEEAFRAAGYSEAESRMAATWGVELPQLAQLKALAQNMVNLANSYQQAGDGNSAEAALQMAINLGQQLDGPAGGCTPLITRLVGIAAERMAFGSMDALGSYGDATVQQQLDQLVQRRQALRDLADQTLPLQGQMSTADWINYNDRTLIFGEENAMAWLVGKYGGK